MTNDKLRASFGPGANPFPPGWFVMGGFTEGSGQGDEHYALNLYRIKTVKRRFRRPRQIHVLQYQVKLDHEMTAKAARSVLLDYARTLVKFEEIYARKIAEAA